MSQAAWYNRWTLSQFSKLLKGDILEIGCGIGNFTKTLETYGNVYAIDINRDYIGITKRKINKKDQAGFGDIESGKYFFGEKLFDNIVCINVLEHIKNDEQALKNMYQLLKVGGHLILLVPAHQFLYGEIDRAILHHRRYSKKKLTKLLEGCGFNIVKTKFLNILGAIGWFVSAKVLKNNMVEEEKIRIFNLIAPIALSLEQIFGAPFGLSILVIAKK